MTISGKIGVIGAGIAAAAVVLLVLHAAHSDSPLDFFAARWRASAFMSHVNCGCAMQPAGECFHGDWQALVRQGNASRQFGANVSSLALAKHSVCTGTPAVVRGCLRTDLERHGEKTNQLAKLEPNADQRRIISSTFLDILEYSMDGCDGQVCEVDEEDVDDDEEEEEEEEGPGRGPGGMDGRKHGGMDGRSPGGRPPLPNGRPPVADELPLRDPEDYDGLVDAAVKTVTSIARQHRGHRVLQVLHRHSERYLRGLGEMEAVDGLLSDEEAAGRELYPIEDFISDFRDWRDGDEPIEMSISGSGWRRCLRSFVWALRKHWTCPVGVDLMNWSHGLRAVRLFTRNVVPEFEFEEHPGNVGTGVFVMQPLGTTRWELAPREGDTPISVIVRAGDIIYVPRQWVSDAECLTARCVSMTVSP